MARPKVPAGSGSLLLARRPSLRRQALDVEGDRLAVGLGEAAGAFDDLAHARADIVEIGQLAVLQHLDHLLELPVADAARLVGADVGRVLSVGTAFDPGIGAALLA